MKYLLALIDHSVPNIENKKYLQGLILDARPTKSKWSDSSRIGQAELYDGLERILTDISNFTPYSTPFAQKVNRKEVPDYYDIIKKPMDFGTMWKKLKAKMYNSKKEFEQDLELVYNNCFEYNIDQESTLRKYIVLLKEKWTKLLPLVSDITIQRREDLTSSLDNIDIGSSSSFLQSPKMDIEDRMEMEMTEMGGDHGEDEGIDKSGIKNASHYHHHHHYSYKHCSSLVPKRTLEGMANYRMARIKSTYRPFVFYPELQFPGCILPDDKKYQETISKSDYQYKLPLLVVENINLQRAIYGDSPLELEYFDYYRDIETFSKLHTLQQQKRLAMVFLLHAGFSSASTVSLEALNDLISLSLNEIGHKVKELMPCRIENVARELTRGQEKKLLFHLKEYFLIRNIKLREAINVINSFERVIMDTSEVEFDGATSMTMEDDVIDADASTTTNLDIYGLQTEEDEDYHYHYHQKSKSHLQSTNTNTNTTITLKKKRISMTKFDNNNSNNNSNDNNNNDNDKEKRIRSDE